MPEAAENNLAGTQWQLESFGPPGAETPVIEASPITLEFGPDGEVGGSGGCNTYGGEYQLQEGTLSFSNIISTQMACTDQGLTNQEQQYFQALRSASQFELTEDRLTIRSDGGQGVLTFVNAPASAGSSATTE